MVQAYSFAKCYVKRQILRRTSWLGRVVVSVRAWIDISYIASGIWLTVEVQMPQPTDAGILCDMGQGWLIAEAVTSLRIVWETANGV